MVRIAATLFRAVTVVVDAAVVLMLAVMNVRLYAPGRMDATMTQLQFIKQDLSEGGAERMQSLFPEGYLFTWALYGLASANVARSLAPTDPRRTEALRAAREAIMHVDSSAAKAPFTAAMTPSYGAFYAGWSLYLRGAVLRASGPADPVPFDRQQYENDCDSLAAALASSGSPFLASFPGAVWPVDTTVGIAALAIADPFVGHRYEDVIASWVSQAHQRRNLQYGALSHIATLDGQPLAGPRGGSLAMMSYVLAEVDPVFARRQYDVLRRRYVVHTWGLPGVREYPHGVDGEGDVDSGPLMFGVSGSASVLAIGAAIANGDEALATTLLETVEFVGMPIESAGRRRYAFGLLPVGDAFLAWARSAPPLVPGTGYSDLVPRWWRLLLHALSLLVGAAVVYGAARITRRSRVRRDVSAPNTFQERT